MKPTLRAASASLAIALGAALPAHAQFQKPEDAIRYRQSVMFTMSHHLGRIAAMANGRVPFDAKAAADNAALVETLSKLPFVAFVPGSDQGKTRADPDIWKEADKFRANATKMQDEVVKLNAAARAGSLDQIKTAVGAVGQSCKACHDAYRKE